MNDDDEHGRPSEGQPKERSGGGCAGCLLPLIIGALVTYCSIDKSDFYLLPGEADLWTDAMEVVFENLDQVTPDSLEIDDPLNVLTRSDSYKNIHNISYVLHPFIKVRSKEHQDNTYLMRVISIVRHTGPNEFTIKEIEMDTLVAIPKKLAQAP